MTIRFCSLASGSSGNCHFVSNDKEALLIDAGLSGKKIQGKLEEIGVSPAQLTGILISHEHSDHIHSAGILSRRFNIPIYANEGTWKGMECKLGELKENNIKLFNTNKSFSIGDITIMPYATSHDANESVGFSFHCNKIKISITTDLGYIDGNIIDRIKDSNLVVLESNHDEEMLKAGSYPYYLKRRILSDHGHLSNDAAGWAIVDLVKNNVHKVMLAHLSKENNFPELAIATVEGILKANQVDVGRDIILDLASRDRISNLYQFK
ncbi:MBL fold metallo-hydrolase [Alkaliphilus serpentinus]|uniref:MBL fold metallo-hydrolase n=1 Tax=Alkaliphilus serpentinus TaxID=1482731 RepID=A0A833HQN9_9FIRM|nr:MBL fold metallo-hydrolase [Alkaliphilus serpentinus]KAB3532176.1 MBL fold metallo-hydrolase [Alkaliphilus serpentinus]